MSKKKKIVLAYSGGLDTSVLLSWIKDKHNAEMIAFCADIGQEDELKGLKQKAMKTGASKLYIDDLQAEFARDFIFPMMQASAIYEGQYYLGTSIARPLIAKRQIDIARLKHHDQMKQHVSGFRGQLLAVALGRLDDRLNGLLAEFLGAFLGAFGQQFRGPGGVRIGPLAGGNDGGKAMKGGHVSLTGMPAAAMWALA